MASFERLHSKASPLKIRKASKDQEEIFTCALKNGCSKIGKALGESLCLKKLTVKNLWWSSLIVKLQSTTSMKENSTTSVSLLIMLNFSEQLS